MPERSAVLYRVDPRLVHSTLMNAWVPALGIQQLLIADESVVTDARRRNILEIAAVDVERVLFSGEAGAADMLRASDLRTAVLFSDLAGADRAIQGGLRPPTLNVGHVPEGTGRRRYLPSVFLGARELEVIRRIEALGTRVELRALPEDAPLRIEASGSSAPTEVADGAEPAAGADASHAEGELEVVNERGLHLRAAHVLAALCNRLPQTIEVGRDDFMVNAKSLLGLTALGAAAGTRLKVVVTGPGAQNALAELRQLFASGFQEGAAPGRGAGNGGGSG